MSREKYDLVDPRSGQAMLIAVLSLGGAILGATAIAGLLTLYQIRATTDTENSAKAIFAADAGVEWALFDHYCQLATSTTGCVPGVDYPLPAFSDGASFIVNCYPTYDATAATSSCSAANTETAISSGFANGAERAFFASINSPTSSYP